MKDYGTVSGDTVHSYSPLAVHLAEGGGYRVFDEPYMRYPPLFPLFIAFIYRVTGHADTDNTVYRYAVLALQSVTVVFLYAAAREFFGRARALFASLLWLFHPVVLLFAASRYAWNAASLLLFFFFAGLYFYVSALNRDNALKCAPAGFVLGLSALVWPGTSYLWLPFSLAPFILKKARPWLSSAVFTVFFLLPIMAWSWVVYKNTGAWAVSDNLFTSMSDGLTYETSGAFETSALVHRARAFISLESAEETRRILAFYLSELANHPLDLAGFLAVKAARAWYATISETGDFRIFVFQLPYLALGMAGLCLAWREERRKTVFLLAVIFYLWTVTVSVLAILRYMMPALGLMAMFGGFAVERIVARLSGGKKRQDLDMLGAGKHVEGDGLA